MEYLPIVLTISVAVLTITLVVVGVYVVQVLQRMKYTLDKLNSTIDLAEDRLIAIGAPLQSLSNMASNFTTGMKVFESFLGWMNRGKRDR